MSGAALAAAAERLVGTPFRWRGRDPARGLDCLGLVLAALEAIGRPARAPTDYRLRRLEIERFLTAAAAAGLAETARAPEPGDILLLRPGPAQHHLLIAAPDGLIHAHAGLGRVVLTPPPWPEPIERRWRLTEQGDRQWPLCSSPR